MNLPLYLRVLRRFKFLIAIGFVLAVAIATASMVRVSFAHGLSASYRQHETWQSTTRLFVTEKGFPWGQASTPPSTSQDSGRLQGLAVLYAQLINGNPIQSEIYRFVPRGDLLAGASVTDPVTSTVQPLVDVVGTAQTSSGATRVSQTGARLFQRYIAGQQALNHTRTGNRVLLESLYTTRPKLTTGRKKTLAIAAFLAVMAATLGLAFVLENLRPAVSTVESALPDRPAQAERNVA